MQVQPGFVLPTAATMQTNPALAPAGLAVAPPAVGMLQTGVLLTGKVKAWYDDKGFGFLMPDGGGPDVFVHRNQLSDGQSLEQGSTVAFEVRLNAIRGKYEATRCDGAIGNAPAAGAMSAALGKGAAPCVGKGQQYEATDNLFVAGLPLDTSEERVREFFGQYGVVKRCKVLPENPGKPDRAALIQMGDKEQSAWLVENLNGNVPAGMVAPITVRFADNRAEKVETSAPIMARAVSLAVLGDTGGYGKAVGKGAPVAANRFSPYGIPGTVAPASGDTQLSTAALAAALTQLNSGNDQQAQLLQAIQAIQALQQPTLPDAGGLPTCAASMPTAAPAGTVASMDPSLSNAALAAAFSQLSNSPGQQQVAQQLAPGFPGVNGLGDANGSLAGLGMAMPMGTTEACLQASGGLHDMGLGASTGMADMTSMAAAQWMSSMQPLQANTAPAGSS